MKKDIKKYPGIQVTLDIHRDALGGNERIKPTVTINGKKAAQLMIVSGCDDDGTQDFPNWEYNLRFALRLQQSAVQLYPGLARPIDFCNAQYNENRTKGSLLVEFGTEVNTVEEAIYSGTLFGKTLVKTLLALK
jgi:stage II sporulation protein P